MLPRETIRLFDAYLLERDLELTAVLVGGAALALLGITDRQTRDCDILQPELPVAIANAAVVFAESRRAVGDELANDWLNNGPSQLCDVLPADWPARIHLVFEGQALTLSVLGRPDLLKTKLFALCDRATDLPDCEALAPTATELAEAEPWVAKQDGHPGWPDHVRTTLADLARRLGHGV